jgi:hypothetical protein
MGGHIHVDDAAAIMGQYQEDVNIPGLIECDDQTRTGSRAW